MSRTDEGLERRKTESLNFKDSLGIQAHNLRKNKKYLTSQSSKIIELGTGSSTEVQPKEREPSTKRIRKYSYSSLSEEEDSSSSESDNGESSSSESSSSSNNSSLEESSNELESSDSDTQRRKNKKKKGHKRKKNKLVVLNPNPTKKNVSTQPVKRRRHHGNYPNLKRPT
ncbi:uncharacterized protein DDB_G0280579-like [Clytia hemisphaerica]|uniref:uncharacterized protein DDB_G0280579-like n=1 Tax=Clytia hemisphaerica TaxID=252671 RepID=UPI0034D4F681